MDVLKEFGIIPVNTVALETLFTSYKYPQKKVRSLEQKGLLLRMKRGLFVVSPAVSGKSLSAELIANHIYGPSYVSMETALRYYGLIPESVYTVRSMTINQKKKFGNPIGNFEYIHCPVDYYPIGISQIVKENYSFLMASPEKALCDLVVYTPKLRPRFLKSMYKYLEEDLRLDMDAFFEMKATIFNQCARFSRKKNEIYNLVKILGK
ncbi:MAG TPA: hypothetical protein DDW27_04775 [Bacteroidales bacterium]|nr:hypothetical protein [Bacteroidales bacterium]